ncbi:hypothetical protein ACFL59_10745 [Planctomycetota bacterium]
MAHASRPDPAGGFVLFTALGRQVAIAADTVTSIDSVPREREGVFDIRCEPGGRSAADETGAEERVVLLRDSGLRLLVGGPVWVAVVGRFEVAEIPAYLETWADQYGVLGLLVQEDEDEEDVRLIIDPECTARAFG